MPTTKQEQFIRYRFNGATCPACGEQCGGNATAWENGSKAIMCLHTLPKDSPDGWFGVQKPGGWSMFWANSDAAKAQWDECVKESNSSEVVTKGSSSKKGFVKKDKNLITQAELDLFMSFASTNKLLSSNYPAVEGTQNLLNRGLSLETIEKYEFIDFNQINGCTIPSPVKSVLLKLFGNKAVRQIEGGIRGGGHLKLCPYYIIPVRDFDDKVRGFQLRRLPTVLKAKKELAESRGEKFTMGKYVWAGNYNSEGKQWSGACPTTGTAPLQTLKAEEDCRYLLLTEGTLKPLIVYENLNAQYNVLGASGGAFCASSGIFLAALYSYKLQYGIEHVVFIADPGSYEKVEKDGKLVYKRTNVVANIASAKEFCEQHGFKFSVLDYGQLEHKEGHLEPDDLPAQTIIEGLPKLAPSPKEQLGKMVANVFTEQTNLKIDYDAPGSSHMETIFIDSMDELPTIYAQTNKRFIINNTALGAGKSYTVNKTLHEGKHIYVSLTPRNPATPEIEEEFYKLEGRHSGLVYTGTSTPKGYPVTRRPKSDEEPQTDANCAFADAHSTARVNGLNSGRVCMECPFRNECVSGEHESYNYLYQRIQAQTHTKLRASIATLNPEAIDESVLLTIDEPTSSAPFASTFSINTQTLRYYQGEINAILGDGALSVDLDMVASFKDAEEILKAARKVDEDIQEALKKQYYSTKNLNSHYSGAKALCFQWVKLLLNPLIKWRLEGNTYTALTHNDTTIQIIHNAGQVIFLDATCEPEVLAAQYQLPLDDCVVIRNTDKATQSVSVEVLLADGFNSRRQSIPTKKKVMGEIRELLVKKYSKDSVGFITHSEYCEEGDIAFFSESRGSNRFKKMKVICTFGLPQIDLEGAHQQWQLISDRLEDWDFQNYYNHLTHSEIKQSIGRVRGYQRTDEQLKAYVVANCKLGKLEKEGYRVNYKVAAFAGIKSAYNAQLTALEDIYRAASILHSTKKQLTQTAISETLGKSRQTISKSLKRLNLTLETLNDFFQIEVVPGNFQSIPSAVDMTVKATEKAVIGEQFRYTMFDGLSLETTMDTMKALISGVWPAGYKRREVNILLGGLTYRMRGWLNSKKHLTNEFSFGSLLEGLVKEELS